MFTSIILSFKISNSLDSVSGLSNHKWFQLPFPCIWRGNSKSNGSPISLLVLHNKFLIWQFGFSPKTLFQSLQRPPFKSFLITFCYHDLLSPMTKISKCISKYSDKKLQKHRLSFLIPILMMTLHPLLSQRITMKICVMTCYTCPWSNASKSSSKSLCEVLQKRIGDSVSNNM